MFMGDSNGTNVVQDLGYLSIEDIVSFFLTFAISYGHQDSVRTPGTTPKGRGQIGFDTAEYQK
jgi:hypothetical protein